MIVVDNLYKRFNHHDVLRGVSFSVNRGETAVVIGRSGCGKSVLLKHILGLMKPDSGSIRVTGEEITTMDHIGLDRMRCKFGMLFQGAALFDSLNVYENVSFGLRRVRKQPERDIREKVAKVLSQVGLPGIEEKSISDLSGGMRKRVGLARAIAMDPEILLYDEPTTGLDPIMSRAIDELIVKMKQELNVTSIVITHDITSVFRVAGRVFMMHDGVIIDGGTPEELKRTEHPVLRQFIDGATEGPISVYQ
ncbi:MAG: ABC transporter ATP-binding protein [Spirochaetes bacterium]|nr:ABC transporter ATP-binding protein [Spirochaetota bacterium]